MSKGKWADFGKYLEIDLSEYQELVSLASANMTKNISTFKSILSHAGFLISMSTELQDGELVLEGYGVWRLALDIITRAADIRDLLADMEEITQMELSRVKELMQAFETRPDLSPGDSENLGQKVTEVGQGLQKIKKQTEVMLPDICAVFDMAKSLQEKVEDLAARIPPVAPPRQKPGWPKVGYDSLIDYERCQDTNLYRLIFPAPEKIGEN